MAKYLRISSYNRKPFLIYNFAFFSPISLSVCTAEIKGIEKTSPTRIGGTVAALQLPPPPEFRAYQKRSWTKLVSRFLSSLSYPLLTPPPRRKEIILRRVGTPSSYPVNAINRPGRVCIPYTQGHHSYRHMSKHTRNPTLPNPTRPNLFKTTVSWDGCEVFVHCVRALIHEKKLIAS